MSGVALVAALLAGCTVTPEPRSAARPAPKEPAAAPRDSAAARNEPATDPQPADPTTDAPVPPDLGDTSAADAVEALRWVAALFATGIDTASETNPLTAWNHADRSAAGAMGSSAPGADATQIVDGILRRYREGTTETTDPRGQREAPAKEPPPAPEKPVEPEKTDEPGDSPEDAADPPKGV